MPLEPFFHTLRGAPLFRRPKGALFIVFEGLDGSGQSTQTVLLKEEWEKRNRAVLLTKEPTASSDAGIQIRDALEKHIALPPATLQELFTEDRKEHVESVIIPSLQAGKTVISDRYFFSSFAFGGIECDRQWLRDINGGYVFPDITFYLDVSPRTAVERIRKRGKNVQFFEVEEILKKVREEYRSIAKEFRNVYTIDGEKPVEEVHETICRTIRPLSD